MNEETVMFTNLLNAFSVPTGLKAAAAAAVFGIMPTAAMARDHVFVDLDFGHVVTRKVIRFRGFCFHHKIWKIVS